jgi:hypothetical protein
MTGSTFYSDFRIGDRVVIDQDNSLVASVTAYLYRSTGAQAEISWVHAGTIQTAWIDVWRLSKAP